MLPAAIIPLNITVWLYAQTAIIGHIGKYSIILQYSYYQLSLNILRHGKLFNICIYYNNLIINILTNLLVILQINIITNIYIYIYIRII